MDFESIAKRHAAQDPNVLLWSCTDLLSNKGSRKNRYAMIILNQPITRKDVFVRAWAASEVRLCADGGANRLYDLWGPSQSSKYLPDMVKGDLDSLRPEVESFYASKGVTIKHDSDQYSTDLMKCMEEVENIERASGRRYSLVFIGGLSGRVDQTVHTMHILHKLRKTRPLTFVLSCESLAWTLDAGSHLIDIDHSTMGQTCGILPVGVDSATVKTKGLKWDLDWATSLDTSVSTSNHLLPSEPVVQVQTSRPLLWCVEIKPNLDAAPVPAVRDVKSPVGVSEFGTGRVSRVGTY
ncbi:Thiamin pyrophosphokinase [Kockovaella imperatae]|uniref:Thiamine pyrophosphokinase n=1 Tax=Kockovaella imperatae TaxID=4999 RepID=A0A1Y1UUE6_9TREE|nr:Thiamin pyrophosphokinase [Kockovaella imperatae]ORX41277.1 Thiamin pyrophosphokinase [Kockovaella imperatae]